VSHLRHHRISEGEMIAEITLSGIVSINIGPPKGSTSGLNADLLYRAITLVDKDGKEHTIYVFGTFGNDLPVSL
jgi:hypothetical protein